MFRRVDLILISFDVCMCMSIVLMIGVLPSLIVEILVAGAYARCLIEHLLLHTCSN